jgi:hypothetical protein
VEKTADRYLPAHLIPPNVLDELGQETLERYTMKEVLGITHASVCSS